jgi:hypothetical protein
MATINGSITYAVEKIPILGPLLIVGGLGYYSLRIYSSKISNGASKLKSFGCLALGTTTSVGGSISGALLG